MKVGSLFSGIGGLDLGLEQAGMETVWQVEYDDWARGKLDENFPHTQKFKDVREVGEHNLEPVDLICGGFPCQDISALKFNREGLAGKRSGLWAEYFRIICEMRPGFVVIENVSALIANGLDRLLCDLTSVGFDAEWQTLRASDVDLPQSRQRLFVVAYPAGKRSFSTAIFNRGASQSRATRQVSKPVPCMYLEALGRTYPEIPEHLRMDNGLSFELSEIEAAIKGYGNAVAPPVAKWIGERIIEFDNAVRKAMTSEIKAAAP